MNVPQLMRQVAASPQDPWLRFLLGKAFVATGQLDNALGELRLARKNPVLRPSVDRVLAQTTPAACHPERCEPNNSRRVWRVLRHATLAAAAMKRSTVGTEHLLLGLVRENSGTASRVLTEFGIDEATASSAIGPAWREAPNDRSPGKSQSLSLALAKARDHAIRLNHSELRTDHLLLAITDIWSCGAARVLERNNASTQAIRQRLFSLLATTRMPYAASAREVFRTSDLEAARLSQHWIGTEHVLLGLLQNKNTFVAHLLAGHGVRMCSLRQAIRRLVTPGSRHASGARRATPLLRELLARARRGAQRSGVSEVGSTHLLSALLSLSDSVACRALARLNVDAIRLGAALAQAAPRGNRALQALPAETITEEAPPEALEPLPLIALPLLAALPRVTRKVPRRPRALDPFPRWKHRLTQLNWILLLVLIVQSLHAAGYRFAP
jgi:ATP-dependent Clp protease ATP-binding subunit ClpA